MDSGKLGTDRGGLKRIGTDSGRNGEDSGRHGDGVELIRTDWDRIGQKFGTGFNNKTYWKGQIEFHKKQSNSIQSDLLRSIAALCRAPSG